VAGSCEHGNEPLEFHKRQGFCILVEWLLASLEGLCSVESVGQLVTANVSEVYN